MLTLPFFSPSSKMPGDQRSQTDHTSEGCRGNKALFDFLSRDYQLGVGRGRHPPPLCLPMKRSEIFSEKLQTCVAEFRAPSARPHRDSNRRGGWREQGVEGEQRSLSLWRYFHASLPLSALFMFLFRKGGARFAQRWVIGGLTVGYRWVIGGLTVG